MAVGMVDGNFTRCRKCSLDIIVYSRNGPYHVLIGIQGQGPKDKGLCMGNK